MFIFHQYPAIWLSMNISDVKSVYPRLQGAVIQQNDQVRGSLRETMSKRQCSKDSLGSRKETWTTTHQQYHSSVTLPFPLSPSPMRLCFGKRMWQRSLSELSIFIHWLMLWFIWRHLQLNPTSLIQSGAIDLFRDYLPKDTWRTLALLPSWSIKKHTYLFSEGYWKNKLINV